MDVEDKNLNVNSEEIWKICGKIQAAVLCQGFDLQDDFKNCDHHGDGFIDEIHFLNVLGKYKMIIGLLDFEIYNLSQHFQNQNKKINYKEFCTVACDTNKIPWKKTEGVNLQLTEDEKLKLRRILIKIADASTLSLRPYFEDYDLVTGNVGTVTVAHFSRVLHFMKIILSEEEYLLLLKRYMKNSYTVNYVAFVTHVDAIKKYFKEKRIIKTTKDQICFPGYLADLELSEEKECSFNDVKILDVPREHKDVLNAIFQIQRYAYENRIRLTEFMETFDPLRCGRITKSQFLRALDSIGISVFKSFKLSQNDIDLLCATYTDNEKDELIKWREFVDEIDRVFTEKNLDKNPLLEFESPPDCIKTLQKQGQKNWSDENSIIRDLCEEMLLRIQMKIANRRIYLYPFFRSFDKLNKGYIRPGQVLRVLLSNNILTSEDDFEALKVRYCNDMGFNYISFLEEIDPLEYAPPKIKPTKLVEKKDQTDDCVKTGEMSKQNVIKALAKVKKQISVNNVKLIDFLVDYDRHKENEILEVDFRRGVDNANIKLSEQEIGIICNIFRSPNHSWTIRYRDFCNTLDEIFTQGEFNVIPNPLKHFPCIDCLPCFLNIKERMIASKALQKLARTPDTISNLWPVCKDFDKENCGTITQNQFLRALTVRDMNTMINSREFETICKCFGYERGLKIEFNYRAFLDILDILNKTGQVRRINAYFE